MAASQAPPGDEAEEPPAHPPVPEEAPEIDARMADLPADEAFEHVLYTDCDGQHIYCDFVVDVGGVMS
jgi:hypothetical protein